ncbi:hypothetical protein QKW60_01610 [Defluviimonas aestuarii]|uniref:hypothetical protein n=1 Tax=Albidovulum aestuarii TaxID=1130726 RepID=UPI00249A24BC|nr:hypothetical protein [Defluviimonas aestuarii]MDI3335090.1 hypothetical protein [Defluviimonas aestuarii]
MSSELTTHLATLVHGMRYAVLNWPNPGVETVFKRGDGVPISAEMKQYLEANAVDQFAVDDGYGERTYRTRCKFHFTPITETVA